MDDNSMTNDGFKIITGNMVAPSTQTTTTTTTVVK